MELGASANNSVEVNNDEAQGFFLQLHILYIKQPFYKKVLQGRPNYIWVQRPDKHASYNESDDDDGFAGGGS